MPACTSQADSSQDSVQVVAQVPQVAHPSTQSSQSVSQKVFCFVGVRAGFLPTDSNLLSPCQATVAHPRTCTHHGCHARSTLGFIKGFASFLIYFVQVHVLSKSRLRRQFRLPDYPAPIQSGRVSPRPSNEHKRPSRPGMVPCADMLP